MRSALVTGVSRRAGIGYAIAQRLVETEIAVFTQGWTSHDATQPWGADDFEPSIEADFADPDTPARVVEAARAAIGPLDAIVAVSKGALAVATATLADALADRGITVNCVNPGPTDTGWGLGERDPTPHMPAGRWGEPDDAARLICWLCSDEARWITGQVLDSEGGFRR